jgi:arylsulfatase
LNAYTYGDPKWFPDMPATLREYLHKVTKGSMSGNAGETTPLSGVFTYSPFTLKSSCAVLIQTRDSHVEKAGMEFLETAAKVGKPFFININFMKVHQPNLPHPDFIDKSPSKTKFADSIVEADTRIGEVLDKIRVLGLVPENKCETESYPRV